MSTAPSLPRPINWKWYFLGIALVATVLLGWLVIFAAQQLEKSLTLDQLVAARKIWEAKGPKNYQMLYSVKRSGDGSLDRFFVEVRGGEVKSVILNGGEQLPRDKYVYSSMEGLFDDIEIFLKLDARPNSPKTYSQGYFDREDGHLLLFNRQVYGGKEKVEIKVEEFRPQKGP
jgi:hypothetical protein